MVNWVRGLVTKAAIKNPKIAPTIPTISLFAGSSLRLSSNKLKPAENLPESLSVST